MEKHSQKAELGSNQSISTLFLLGFQDCYGSVTAAGIFPFFDQRYLFFLSLSHRCVLGEWTHHLNLEFTGLQIERAHCQGVSSVLRPNLDKEILDLRPEPYVMLE